MNPMHDHIGNLITMGQAMKSDPNIDKKSLNKTLARLEEAQLWSKELIKGHVYGDQQNLNSTEPKEFKKEVFKCICPDGAVDANCPVHNKQI
jgi:hypothetical protein